MIELPAHLQRYIVDQDYSRYTPVDQEVWRYIMRQLMDFLSRNAHPCYIQGLKDTGIEADRIPEIRNVSAKLEKFGWRAVPVSGFIPPAAFMELQALGYLPIASDMRSIDHLMYTPAPDIVHEAAGHAPILVDKEFARYLQDYAQVARKAIISHEDMRQYEAIRVLSDLKEDPSSTAEQIALAEKKLNDFTRSISFISEAAYLSRMNWWTAEYGLIGSLENPKIFGAGLLSSVGEARECLTKKVKKIPLTLDCVNYTYDITEKQPQLFVTPSFQHLRDVLEELASTMAFRMGGFQGLRKAHLAQTVNTVELNSGLQISGRLKNFSLDPISHDENNLNFIYLQFEGPSQLAVNGKEIMGHGVSHHAHGFGSPVGWLAGSDRCLSEMTNAEVASHGIRIGHKASLKFQAHSRSLSSSHDQLECQVSGMVTKLHRDEDGNGKLLIVSFSDCTVKAGDRILFDPAWGDFDMAIGTKVTSVFGGPADRDAYGATDDFVAKTIPRKLHSTLLQKRHALYSQVQQIRSSLNKISRSKFEKSVQQADLQKTHDINEQLQTLFSSATKDHGDDWLLFLDLYELALQNGVSEFIAKVKSVLDAIANENNDMDTQIRDGLRLLNAPCCEQIM